MVDIDHKATAWSGLFFAAAPVERFVKAAAIEQAGQRIARCQIGKALA
jgi:hypothetical protein